MVLHPARSCQGLTRATRPRKQSFKCMIWEVELELRRERALAFRLGLSSKDLAAQPPSISAAYKPLSSGTGTSSRGLQVQGVERFVSELRSRFWTWTFRNFRGQSKTGWEGYTRGSRKRSGGWGLRRLRLRVQGFWTRDGFGGQSFERGGKKGFGGQSLAGGVGTASTMLGCTHLGPTLAILLLRVTQH